MNQFEKLELNPSLRPKLLKDEVVNVLQSSVGLYEGKKRCLEYDDGVVYLTTHRILYVDNTDPQNKSLSLKLGLISDFKTSAGFWKSSSPKVTLYISDDVISTAASGSSNDPTNLAPSTPWICYICNHSNSGDLVKCELCGVKKTVNESSAASSTDSTDKQNGLTCPACTFINHSCMVRCELCDTELVASVDKSTPSDYVLVEENYTRQSTPDILPYVKLSFRSGGHSNFAAELKNALSQKQWERVNEPEIGKKDNDFNPSLGGISGIMRNVDLNTKETDEALNQAFSDLDVLIQKAADMVKIAESITVKLSKEDPGDETSSAATANFKTYLLNLGISSPVTKDKAGAIYHQELAKQLAEFLGPVLEQEGGTISLTDVYCLFNRARGDALISPQDVHKATSLFDSLNLPMRLRKFSSGLLVVQSLSQSDDAIAQHLFELIKANGALSAIDIAEVESVPVVLITEQLLMTEARGLICRDETIEGIKFYENLLIRSDLP
ncbi:Vps36-domain-containing protein [Basidiobolus meristosporus CBS 931.73]|uniref:Vacuolar protein-sorting-associated protein 36 n=1 Tax=Basidiobolus meristosporus CBS 931.73 TaxID=1314790 RepID=A0A1Y1Z343_9FUNG|nr:Vps36-domain-containing protein [Basidiobolus meristosporus CBS 931.73]|eukprot:ORY04710.1 Vps36-domain-containing protein [Basidiobolus meristosporus CBS 931.73]